MKKVSRSILYKEIDSISFFLGEGETLEHDFLDNLRKRPFMQNMVDASINILRIFNNAYYICTLVYEGDYPLFDINDYEKIAIDGHDDPIWLNHLYPTTIALVESWLSSKEARKIFEQKGKLKVVEDLCNEIHTRIEQCYTEHKDELKGYQTLISNERNLPSGFINERSFQRRPFAEVIEDPTIKRNEIFDNLEYLVNVLKHNPHELTSALQSEFIKKQVSNISFNETIFKSNLTEWLDEKMNHAKDETTVIEQAFNAQTGLPCFTSRQMGILLTAVGRLTETDNQPGKTTLGDIVQRITGYKSITNSQNMRGTISEADKRIVADVLRKQFPNLADEVMKVF